VGKWEGRPQEKKEQDTERRLDASAPDLARSFTTFQHWKGTMEYHKTKDILHVKSVLGHKNIQNMMVYISLERTAFASKDDEFHMHVATNTDEACKLIQVGFEYVTGEYNDGGKILIKRR
jgi:hypothetical protein